VTLLRATLCAVTQEDRTIPAEFMESNFAAVADIVFDEPRSRYRIQQSKLFILETKSQIR
jgi:hypothetical protein